MIVRKEIDAADTCRDDAAGACCAAEAASVSAAIASPSDVHLRRWAWWLTAFTIAWNVIEAVVAIASGIVASSIALVGFGCRHANARLEQASSGVRPGVGRSQSGRRRNSALHLSVRGGVAWPHFKCPVWMVVDGSGGRSGSGRACDQRGPRGLVKRRCMQLLIQRGGWLSTKPHGWCEHPAGASTTVASQNAGSMRACRSDASGDAPPIQRNNPQPSLTAVTGT
jgi:hypothetical protein